jgi:hypothetical protein
VGDGGSTDRVVPQRIAVAEPDKDALLVGAPRVARLARRPRRGAQRETKRSERAITAVPPPEKYSQFDSVPDSVMPRRCPPRHTWRRCTCSGLCDWVCLRSRYCVLLQARQSHTHPGFKIRTMTAVRAFGRQTSGRRDQPSPRGSPVVLHHPLLVHPDPVRASRSRRPYAQLNKSTNPRADARAVDNREVPAMGSAVALGGVPVQPGALCMEAPRLILVPPPGQPPVTDGTSVTTATKQRRRNRTSR